MEVKKESEKVGLKLNIHKTKIMASGPITSCQIDGETVETVAHFIFLASKITADGDWSHEITRCLLLGRKIMEFRKMAMITLFAKQKKRHRCTEQTPWKRPWCWETLKAEGEGDGREWDGWMASPTQWTWVWASSGSLWCTGRPCMLQSMGSQRARHNWATELTWTVEIFSASPQFVLTSSCSVNSSNYFISMEACELMVCRASQVALVVKNLPANAGDVRDGCLIPGLGRSLEEEMTTHSSILAWRIPWTEEPGKLQSLRCKESDMTEVIEHAGRVSSLHHLSVWLST